MSVADDNRIAEILARYTVDQSSLQQFSQANAQAKESLKQTADAGRSLAETLAMPDAAAQLGVTTEEIKQLRQALGVTVEAAAGDAARARPVHRVGERSVSSLCPGQASSRGGGDGGVTGFRIPH